MEKSEGVFEKALKNENLNLDERKKIATEIEAGFEYLKEIEICYSDRKFSNFLQESFSSRKKLVSLPKPGPKGKAITSPTVSSYKHRHPAEHRVTVLSRQRRSSDGECQDIQ
jgi:hypothetical protein